MGRRTHQQDREVSLVDPHILPPCPERSSPTVPWGHSPFCSARCAFVYSFNKHSLSLDPVPGTQPGIKVDEKGQSPQAS